MRGSYQTESHKFVLEAFKNDPGIPHTIDDIFDTLKSQNISIGRTTIYRQIIRLCDEGVIQKTIQNENKSSEYQYVADCKNDDYHLVCEECGKMIHLTCDFWQDTMDHVAKSHGFHVNRIRTTIYGLCNTCYRQSKQHRENQ